MNNCQSDMLFAVRSSIVAMITFLCINIDALAHGINFETIQMSPVVTVHAYFSRTSPVGDAAVTVMAPGSNTPWQTGRTDKSGHFAFLPDQAGTWRVRVDDERGHMGRVEVIISQAFFNEEHHVAIRGDGSSAMTERFIIIDEDAEMETTENISRTITRHESHDGGIQHGHVEEIIMEKKLANQIPLVCRIVFGLSVIFGFTGILYGLRAHKALRKERTTH